MNFYEVGGLLVRTGTPVRAGIELKNWDGECWVRYVDVDAVARWGRPLTDAQALALLHETLNRFELEPLADRDASITLTAPSGSGIERSPCGVGFWKRWRGKAWSRR